jgi:hypothetical protein
MPLDEQEGKDSNLSRSSSSKVEPKVSEAKPNEHAKNIRGSEQQRSKKGSFKSCACHSRKYPIPRVQMMLCCLPSPDLQPCLQRKANADDVNDDVNDDGGDAECAVSQSQTCMSVACATAVIDSRV